MKVALIHDWLTGMRGGEYVLEAIAEFFPSAELFTLLYVPGSVSPILLTLQRNVSWLQKVPMAEQYYRYFLPLMPTLIEKFDLSGFDLIISSSHCVAKGIRKPPHSVHISYVHAPMRYVWDRYEDYFGQGRSSWFTRMVAGGFRNYFQNWDRKVSSKDRVDCLIANSRYIAEQIRIAYFRESTVIHPFVDLNRFKLSTQKNRNYIMVGAFAPYKRVDLAIEAFNRMKLPLLIVGSGQGEARLKKMAGPTVDFLGALSNAALTDIYSKARALIFPGKEDFGITPLEAMASGTPVIAYAAGGVLDTVTEQTGIFFHSQTVDALIQAVQKLENNKLKFTSEYCRKGAMMFSKDRFQSEFLSIVQETWKKSGQSMEKLDTVVEYQTDSI